MSRGLARAALIVALAALAACASSAPHAGDVAALVDPGTPGWRLEREQHLVLGRLTLAFARAIVRLADEEEAASILAGVRRVEVASYRVVRRGESPDATLGELERRLSASGWEPVVRTREAGETTWVLQHLGDDGGIDRMLVVALDGGSLEVVRLDGDIERVVSEAVAADPGATLGSIHRSAS